MILRTSVAGESPVIPASTPIKSFALTWPSAIATLIAFSIITETVFQWPGMGFLFIQAVQFVDIPIMSAYLVFIAFIFVMINFIVDILYYFIDPRIRVKGDVSSG